MEITGIGQDLLLNRLTTKRIAVWRLIRLDDFRMRLCIFYSDFQTVRDLAEVTQCEVSEYKYEGIKEDICRVIVRPILWCGMLLALGLVLIGQNYLLFYEITGTETVSKGEVLQNLVSLGVDVGVRGAYLDPKWIKDHMLSLMPQLQWITVTQNGCKAQVVVRERPEKPLLEKRGYANIISRCDAIIAEQSVLRGQAMKARGDSVLKGEMLVSGVVNLDKVFSVVYAKAEIYGNTKHIIEVVIPDYCFVKTQLGKPKQCFWLEIANKRIKLFGNSRISGASCDKMIKSKTVTLPGGSYLPISLVVEYYRSFEALKTRLSVLEAEKLAREYALDYLNQKMIAGEILEEKIKTVHQNDAYYIKIVAQCREMISETVEGKWNKEDFGND